MSVFTPLERPELEAFLEPYGLGRLKDFQGIAAGSENSNFFISLEGGEFVLTLVERGPRADMPFFIELLERLHQAGLPVPYAVPTQGGEALRELAGKPKQKESLWVLLKSARQIKRVFGKVHVNFGEPLPLAEFLERSRPGWAGEDLTGADGWSREVTQGAALELARRINAAVVVNPVNLVALALLSTPRHTADEQVLDRVLAHYQALIAEAPYSTTIIPCHLAPPQIVSYVERLGIIERIAHPLGDLIRIPEGDASLLAYFRNNVLHVFALPALIACLINQNRQIGRAHV